MSLTANQKHLLLQAVHDYGINLRTREIFLHSFQDCADEDHGVDHRASVTFEKNIRLLDSISCKPILVHMHIIGGSWHDGMSMFDCIKASKSKVSIIGYGHIGSMSSIILQAADKRILCPNSEFMIHYGSFGIESNSISAKSAVDWNERCNQLMLEIYSKKCKNSEQFKNVSLKKIIETLDSNMRNLQEWYMTAQEAVSFGFADGILGKDFSIESHV